MATTTTRRLSLLAATLALALLCCHHTASADSDDFAELEGVRCVKPSSTRTDDADSDEDCRDMCDDWSDCDGATYYSGDKECMMYKSCNEYDIESGYTSYVKNFDMIKGGVECDGDDYRKITANQPESLKDDEWVGPTQISFNKCVEECEDDNGCAAIVYSEKTQDFKSKKPRSRQFICTMYKDGNCDKYENPPINVNKGVKQRTTAMAKTGNP